LLPWSPQGSSVPARKRCRY